MIKTYNYTISVDINFEDIAGEFSLSKKSSLEDCKDAIDDYVSGLDDGEFYIIDNEDKIAQDLYDYLQSDEWEDEE